MRRVESKLTLGKIKYSVNFCFNFINFYQLNEDKSKSNSKFSDWINWVVENFKLI